jgi:hypothetical protein
LSESNRIRFAARLRRLPRELLLALVNATAILVMTAAILVLVALWRIENFAGNVVATMTEAVLSKIDLPSRDVLANIQNLRADVRALGQTLSEFRRRENPVIQPEITRLREALTALNASVDRLTSARTLLTDEAIGRLGLAVTDRLTKVRDCASNHTLGDNATENEQRAGLPAIRPVRSIEAGRRHDHGFNEEAYRLTQRLPFGRCGRKAE